MSENTTLGRQPIDINDTRCDITGLLMQIRNRRYDRGIRCVRPVGKQACLDAQRTLFSFTWQAGRTQRANTKAVSAERKILL